MHDPTTKPPLLTPEMMLVNKACRVLQQAGPEGLSLPDWLAAVDPVDRNVGLAAIRSVVSAGCTLERKNGLIFAWHGVVLDARDIDDMGFRFLALERPIGITAGKASFSVQSLADALVRRGLVRDLSAHLVAIDLIVRFSAVLRASPNGALSFIPEPGPTRDENMALFRQLVQVGL